MRPDLLYTCWVVALLLLAIHLARVLMFGGGLLPMPPPMPPAVPCVHVLVVGLPI